VKFEADIDLSQGTRKCNCTICWKKRWWTVAVKPEGFRSLQGEQELSASKPGAERGHSGFCKHCGVFPYAWVPAAEWNDGEYVSVNVAALDDLDPAALATAPITYLDGKADDWWNTPAETRHL
jgi:hypothetical protein